jgi:D-alanyl-D-alanine carboxypeptidase
MNYMNDITDAIRSFIRYVDAAAVKLKQPVKIYLAVVLAVLLAASAPIRAAAANEAFQTPQIVSESAVLMDAKTGQVLYEKNMHTQLYPASITKILTILLGIEHGQQQDKVTMSREAVFSILRGSSHIALTDGEEITLEQALMAAMLPSANDASNGIAEHISGSVEDFAVLMNQRAREAGALNSNFVNPHGLPDEEHVSTAYDMAMITRVALQNDKFRGIFGTVRYTIPSTNKQPESRDLWSEHRMLTTNKFYYEGVIGGKTGYTAISQNTLVTAAQRGDRELIAVVMKSQAYGVYTDTMALFDYGFNQFTEASFNPAELVTPSRGQDQTKLIADILNQNQDTIFTRLIHNSISPEEVSVDYRLVDESQNKPPDLQLNIRLDSAGSLQYADLGSVYLYNFDPAEENGRPAWVSFVVTAFKVLAYLIIGIVALLFILRWFIRARRMLKRRIRL